MPVVLYRVIGTGALVAFFCLLSFARLATLQSRRCGRPKTLGEYVEYFDGVAAAAERQRDDEDEGPRYATGYTAMRFQEWKRAAVRSRVSFPLGQGSLEGLCQCSSEPCTSVKDVNVSLHLPALHFKKHAALDSCRSDITHCP